MKNRTDSLKLLWQADSRYGFKIQGFVSPDDYELVYGSQPHQPIGHIPGMLFRISSDDDSDGFTIRGEDLTMLIHHLVDAEVAYRGKQSWEERKARS